MALAALVRVRLLCRSCVSALYGTGVGLAGFATATKLPSERDTSAMS